METVTITKETYDSMQKAIRELNKEVDQLNDIVSTKGTWVKIYQSGYYSHSQYWITDEKDIKSRLSEIKNYEQEYRQSIYRTLNRFNIFKLKGKLKELSEKGFLI